MRHGKKFNHLGRTAAHRKAMLANMACSLIEHKRINTTVAKAKALKQFVEPLVTKAKAENNTTTAESTHNRRIVFSRLRNKYAVAELFGDVSSKIGDRPGGYTRIIKLGNRLGDNADMAMIELVDFNELMLKETKTKTRRSRRGGKKKEAETNAVPVEETAVVEESAPEAPAEEPKAEVSAEASTSEGEAKEEEAPAPDQGPTPDQALLAEIRDL